MFDLVIFDCDGVLVDSERIANQAFAKLLFDEFGLIFSLEEMFETFVGNSSAQCVKIIEDLTSNQAPNNFEAKYQHVVNHALAHSVQAVKGIESVLQTMDIPYCVASSGSHQKMELTLGKTGLLTYFKGRINSTTDVARGKPHPDIYLHAAKRMGITDPKKCLVIEDSPLGVQGGIAAGMTVFGYCELVKAKKQVAAGAHQTFDDMAQLISTIKGWRNAG